MAAKLTYSEEFDSLHFWDGTSGLDTRPGWAMHWWADHGFAWSATSDTWYVQPSDPGSAHLNPFSVTDGVLTISARRSETEFSDPKGTYHYTSGVLSTFNDFRQTYGYFEIRAKLDLDAGTLPAFWLMRGDGTWPPELDVMEILGSDPTTLIGTVHSQVDGVTMIDPTHFQTASSVNIPDAGAAFHTYGVDWQADKITWYFDGKPIFQADTPSDMHGPMYMIANLNVGGTWEGYPDEGKPFASDYMIDYIRAYDRFPGTDPETPQPTDPPTISSIGGNDRIVSGLVPDRLVTGTAEAGSIVRVFYGDVELGKTVAGLDGGWNYSLTSGNLALIGQGTSKAITAQATGASGVSSDRSNAFTFKVDQSSAVLTTGSDSVELSESGTVTVIDTTLAHGDTITGSPGIDTLVLAGSGALTVSAFNLSRASQAAGISLFGFENIDAALYNGRTGLSLTPSQGTALLRGGAGDDRIGYFNVGGGVLSGNAGIDTLIVAQKVTVDLSKSSQVVGSQTAVNGFEDVDASGSRASVRMTGSSDANALVGGSGADTIRGGKGNDVIDSGAGKDTLFGDAGKDGFVFRSTVKKGTADRIADFSVKDDSIWLDNSVFKKLGSKGSFDAPAKLKKDYFAVGTKANDKNDYLIYDRKSGKLWYDADGSGKGKAVEIATLSKNLKMAYNDLFVI